IRILSFQYLKTISKPFGNGIAFLENQNDFHIPDYLLQLDFRNKTYLRNMSFPSTNPINLRQTHLGLIVLDKSKVHLPSPLKWLSARINGKNRRTLLKVGCALSFPLTHYSIQYTSSPCFPPLIC